MLFFRIFAVLKKVVSIFLLTIMLLGNAGFTYCTHYCMGMAVQSDLMLGHEHMDCGMAMDESTPIDNNQTHLTTPQCCENQYVSIETDETFTKSLDLDVLQTFVTILPPSVLYTLESIDSTTPLLAFDTSPPLLKQDITVLHQVFRI